MIIHRTRRTHLLAAVSALFLAMGALATVTTSAGAATAPHQANKLTQASPTRVSGPAASPSSSFHIYNYNSGLCLGISGDKNDQGAVQWTCNTHADQSWHWGSQNTSHPGWYQLVNGNGSCLGVAGASRSAGARVVGWTCLGSTHPDQYWKPLPYSCSGYVPLQDLNSGDVLGVSGNSTAVGATVVQWPYQNVCNNQFWYGA